jgi:hypothetical protein
MQLTLAMDSAYEGRSLHWEKSSSIRSRPRRVLKAGAEGERLYPPSRQPLVAHPLVKALGGAAIDRVLVQSLYKFLNDIAHLETEVVCGVVLRVAGGAGAMKLPSPLRRDLLSVIVDEGYHAYVAVDVMDQVQAMTGIVPLALPTEIQLGRAMAASRQALAESDRDMFDLAAVCIAENSLTSELLNINRESGLNPTYHQVNSDHMVDEVRHSLIFRQVLARLWQGLTDDRRERLGCHLPVFISRYLAFDIQRDYDRQILESLGMRQDDVDCVLADTHVEMTLAEYRKVNPIIDRICALLGDCGLFANRTVAEAFADAGLSSR